MPSADKSLNMNSRLTELRKLFVEYGVDAYYVPSEDPHMSEYPSAADERRAFISGFTGSAGFALISQQSAWLWTDGRYFLQAAEQMDSEAWVLMKLGTPDCPKMSDHIATQKSIKRLGVDPFLISKVAMDALKKTFASGQVEIVPIHKGFGADLATDLEVMQDVSKGELNLIDIVWETIAKNRPAYASGSLTAVKDHVAGITVAEKLNTLRSTMTTNHCSVIILSALDEIAWLYNLRGDDSADNRVFLAYAIVTMSDALLYLKEHDRKDRLKHISEHLKTNNITVKPYDLAIQDLKDYIGENQHSKVLVPNAINYAVGTLANNSCGGQAVFLDSPVKKSKATKNPVEVRGMKQCHIADGVALAFFFTWLQGMANDEMEKLDEFDISQKLHSFRKAMRGFIKPSFETIAGVDGNGAIVHYRPLEGKSAKVNPDGMLLLDSGGHYETGTTDVTRTVHLGVPSSWERDLFTRVLMGHVDVATAVFPPKLKSGYLDAMARRGLWELGLNYAHGTGHGVGHSICVHEMPPSMSYNFPGTEFEPGMIISDEPGVYLEGQFGIRIESVLLVKPTPTALRFNNETFLGFEQLTLYPYDRKLIELDLLSRKQIAYLNAYHSNVYSKLCAEMKLLPETILNITRTEVIDSLKRECSPL